MGATVVAPYRSRCNRRELSIASAQTDAGLLASARTVKGGNAGYSSHALLVAKRYPLTITFPAFTSILPSIEVNATYDKVVRGLFSFCMDCNNQWTKKFFCVKL